MIVTFNKNSTKSIVEGYYKKHEDFDCKLEISCVITGENYIGISVLPIRTAKLSFVLDGKLSVNGKEEYVRTPISTKDVSDAFKIMLEEEGYTVKKVSFDYDVNGPDKDSGRFNGTLVKMSTKKKIK